MGNSDFGGNLIGQPFVLDDIHNTIFDRVVLREKILERGQSIAADSTAHAVLEYKDTLRFRSRQQSFPSLFIEQVKEWPRFLSYSFSQVKKSPDFLR